ncbi:MAG: hypothetical protein KIT58_07735 [Planctomycetota bacterium]|nr:hypothetical protein [Planctomycetota bacterium]
MVTPSTDSLARILAELVGSVPHAQAVLTREAIRGFNLIGDIARESEAGEPLIDLLRQVTPAPLLLSDSEIHVALKASLRKKFGIEVGVQFGPVTRLSTYGNSKSTSSEVNLTLDCRVVAAFRTELTRGKTSG